MKPVRDDLLGIVNKEFPKDTVKQIFAGTDTNGNENLNWVVSRKVDKKISHENPELYESQVAHGISQFNEPYEQVTQKMHMLDIQPTNAQLRIIEQRKRKLQYNQEQRKQDDFVDPRAKKRRRLIKQKKNKSNDNDIEYKSNKY